jgi:hypothetical protein
VHNNLLSCVHRKTDTTRILIMSTLMKFPPTGANVKNAMITFLQRRSGTVTFTRRTEKREPRRGKGNMPNKSIQGHMHEWVGGGGVQFPSNIQKDNPNPDTFSKTLGVSAHSYIFGFPWEWSTVNHQIPNRGRFSDWILCQSRASEN